MGCDIHAYIDFNDFPLREGGFWISCFAKDVSIGRNYALFSCLAGVRNSYGLTPIVAPRDVPDDVSSAVARDYFYWINDEYADRPREGQSTQYVSEREALSWEKYGRKIRTFNNNRVISGPDWHTASWLNAKELEQAHQMYSELEDESYGDCNTIKAVIAAMKELDGDQLGRSRFIFWFDN